MAYISWNWIKANFVPFHMFIAYVFVGSGLIVNLLMLLVYIFIWPFNKLLYRKLIMNLCYLHWSQFTAVSQWWSGCESVLIMDKKEDAKYVGKEHVVAVMNHKYDIDWLMAWMLAERLEMLGGTKIVGKQSLRFLPIIGWAWIFCESVFLRRSWDKDKETLIRDLRHMGDQPEGHYVTLLLFCEGTRFTADKHQLSMEVAREKGLPELKHHLLPRTKGFVQSMMGLKGKLDSILDLTVAFRADGARPTLLNVLRGQGCKAEVYARRIPLKDVPTDSYEECTAWLHKHYREKDEIFDNFYQNGTFTIGHRCVVPMRINDLVTWLFWAVLLSVPLVYAIGMIIHHASLVQQLSILVLLIIANSRLRQNVLMLLNIFPAWWCHGTCAVVRWRNCQVVIILRAMIAVTEISSASSYGKKEE